LFDLLANYDCQSAKTFILIDLNCEGDQAVELVIEKFNYQEREYFSVQLFELSRVLAEITMSS
jgi:hypothetical protein